MATTTRYAWPTPNLSDPPDVPTDMRELAGAVEQTVGAMDDRLTTLTGMNQSIFQYTALYRASSTVLTVPNAQWYPVTFDTAQLNQPKTMPGFVLASPTRITCYQSGTYRLAGFAGFAQNGTGDRAVAFRVNGNSTGSAYPALQNGAALPNMPWYGSLVVECYVTKNDFIELVVRQTSGAPLKLDSISPRFSMQRVY